MKLWEKGISTRQEIIEFTAGKDRELDMNLAESDLVASMAHVKMLNSCKLISTNENNQLLSVLVEIYEDLKKGKFIIDEGMEDVHSQLEKILTERLGDAGRKVHTARSRNDQVLTDLKLFYRKELAEIVIMTAELVEILVKNSEKYNDKLIPGYTHFQAAMTSSFGLWFGGWAESLTEDLMILSGIFRYINLSPLGSAAGYGSSFPIDREMTSELLEFENLHVNSINAQLSRGKSEKFLLSGMSAIAGSLSKMSMDLVMFMSQNFDFVKLKDELTTGSSIMPHKKNPDVLELIRAKCNRVQAGEFEVNGVINNLPSGYHRDFQLLKEIVFPAISSLKDCIKMLGFVVENIEVKDNIIDNELYKYIGSVDVINDKVKNGVPFREAYVQVASEIEEGKFVKISDVNYSHTGSIGNLGNDKILKKLSDIVNNYETDKYIGFPERFVGMIKEEMK